MLETLGKCKWKDIKVGEVFAIKSCWCIFIRYTKNSVMLLAHNWGTGFDDEIGNISVQGSHNLFGDISNMVGDIYKLPRSTQRLWRQD